MLDDLRNSASKSFFEEEEQPQPAVPERPAMALSELRRQEPFLGMTAQQRFAVALMLFLMVVVLGALFLVATDKVFIGF